MGNILQMFSKGGLIPEPSSSRSPWWPIGGSHASERTWLSLVGGWQLRGLGVSLPFLPLNLISPCCKVLIAVNYGHHEVCSKQKHCVMVLEPHCRSKALGVINWKRQIWASHFKLAGSSALGFATANHGWDTGLILPFMVARKEMQKGVELLIFPSRTYTKDLNYSH